MSEKANDLYTVAPKSTQTESGRGGDRATELKG